MTPGYFTPKHAPWPDERCPLCRRRVVPRGQAGHLRTCQARNGAPARHRRDAYERQKAKRAGSV